jgi:hypothetical protein
MATQDSQPEPANEDVELLAEVIDLASWKVDRWVTNRHIEAELRRITGRPKRRTT